MDGLPQRPEADASLAFLQGLDEERPLSKKLTGSQRPLAPSEAGSSSTMDHPNAVDRRRKRMAVSASSEDGAAKRLKIASTDQDVVVVGTTRPSRYDISQHVRAEVWQHIFTLVPPRSLGKLILGSAFFVAQAGTKQYMASIETFSLAKHALTAQWKIRTRYVAFCLLAVLPILRPGGRNRLRWGSLAMEPRTR
ncbi:hypothetical protein TgHK011_006041 [Trichoderma gracile]|nr:hypothetical protein TgHK011_006041 [Trichoderma gracile]